MQLEGYKENRPASEMCWKSLSDQLHRQYRRNSVAIYPRLKELKEMGLEASFHLEGGILQTG